MKKNLFKMALAVIMFAFASVPFTSCENDPNDPLSGSGKMNYGLKWDNIVKYIINGITYEWVDGDHYECYWSVNMDTLYIMKPTQCTGDTTYIVIPVEIRDTISTEVIVRDTIINTVTETVYDTIYQIDTIVKNDTVYVTKDMEYYVNIVYGEENGYTVEKVGDTLIITITFAVNNDDYSLDIKPTYNGKSFDSGDRTLYVSRGQNVLAGTNARNGIMSFDRANSSAAPLRARKATSGRDTIWTASINNYASGTANRTYVSRKQSAGTRDGFDVAKDSCVYTFDNDGINYNMNIVAESLEGQYKGETKAMLAALPEGAKYEIVNTVDMTNYIVHEGKKCYKVHQVVNGTFESRVLPERGTSRTHTDVVTLDNDVDMDMPVIYLVGDSVTGDDPENPESQGFIFPDGEKAVAAQISVVADPTRDLLVEAILIHTAKSIYMVVDGEYIGGVACTNHSLYNSLYMVSGKWTLAYLVSQNNGVVWYNKKGGSGYPGISKNQIDEYIKNGKAHITTTYTGSFVRDMTLRHVGQTTTFFIDNNGKFTASSSTVTY